MTTVIYETNHTVSNENQIQEFFGFLLDRFPLPNIQKLFIKLQKTKRHYDVCNASSFTNFSRITMIFGFHFDPLNALLTAAHEYMHVIQHDRGEKSLMSSRTTKKRGGSARETEADIFSVEQLAVFCGITPVKLLTQNVLHFYKLSAPEIEKRFGCEIKKKPPKSQQEIIEFLAYLKDGKSLQEIYELQNPDLQIVTIAQPITYMENRQNG